MQGVILAAGRSSRMGEPKPLLPHPEGATVIEHLIAVYLAAEVTPCVVAHGAVLELAEARGARPIQGVPEEDMIDSLIRALQAFPPGVPGIVMQPVDAPFTTSEMIAALTQPVRTHACVLVHRGQPGHPVWVPEGLFSAVLARPEGGLRTLLGDAESVEWPDDSILADVDTPEDRDRWLRFR